MKIKFFLACVITLLAFPAHSFALGLEVAIGGWQQSPEGTVGLKSDMSGDLIDIEDDAGFDDEIRVFGRAKIDMPAVIPNVYLMATPMEFEGRGQKDVNFRFGDTRFTANTPFHTRVEMNQYDLALYYGIPFLETASVGVLNVEIGINARLLDFSAEVKGTEALTSLEETEEESITIPVPMLYLGAQVKPTDWLALEAEGRGIALSGDHYYDFIGRVKVKPVGPLFIAAGFRYENIEISEEDVEADVTFSGPFAEVGLEF